MNKRGGFDFSALIPWIVLGGVFLIVLVATGWTGFEQYDRFMSIEGIGEKISQSQSFSDVWGSQTFFFLDYIFGKIPSLLVEATNPISASIIVIGVWLLFFLVFGDIIGLFGMFTRQVSWIIAAVLVLLISNLKIVMIVTVLALGLTAALGAFSVVASIMLIFGLFLAFHFSFGALGHKIRGGIIMRKAEDQALRAVAGGKKAASGIDVLKEIARKAEEGEGGYGVR